MQYYNYLQCLPNPIYNFNKRVCTKRTRTRQLYTGLIHCNAYNGFKYAVYALNSCLFNYKSDYKWEIELNLTKYLKASYISKTKGLWRKCVWLFVYEGQTGYSVLWHRIFWIIKCAKHWFCNACRASGPRNIFWVVCDSTKHVEFEYNPVLSNNMYRYQNDVLHEMDSI